MTPAFDAFLRSWPCDPWLIGGLLLSAAVYLRGWLSLRRHDARRWSCLRLASFLGGLAAVLLALGSPIESFAGLLLQVHMLQHLLLLMVAPPLIWLAAPLLPMLRGLPRPVRRHLAAPVARSPLVRDVGAVLTHPLVAWPLMTAVVWLWHTPRGYELALRDPVWHQVEHASFLGAALCFWFPVVAPFPSRPTWSRWLVLPYLILADVSNTVLSAWLTFSSTLIYPHYSEVPRVGGWTPLADQQAAGVLMWVPGSLVFLLPVFVIGTRQLYGGRPSRSRAGVGALPALPVLRDSAVTVARAIHSQPRMPWDLLRVRGVGTLLRSRWMRPGLQLVMLLLAILVIADGLLGPQLAPANLAGVAPWIHWRGLVMFGLLVSGNVVCMACPFTLPRRAAGRLIHPRWAWPRGLRNKWLAVALVALFLWSYEAFSLWNSPWLTAWIALSYFVAAFAVDSLFRGAAFCKYVCPIGQFNYVQALVSPLEVRVREPDVCNTCTTKDCIRGGPQGPGCGLQLYQPRKQGNLDCTFCLDCVQACPRQNVGVLIASDRSSLIEIDAFRSGIGRLSNRPDLAALVLLLVFGAFANAAGMIEPVVAWQDAASERLGVPLLTIVTIYYLFALLVAPLLLVLVAAQLSRAIGGSDRSLIRHVCRYALALVPLGFGMWFAHHGFHFLTSYATLLPVAQRMAADVHLAGLGAPQWQHACCAAVPDWIIKVELLALDLGMLASLALILRLVKTDSKLKRPLRACMPWLGLVLLLFACGVCIVLEPMEMRGTLPAL